MSTDDICAKCTSRSETCHTGCTHHIAMSLVRLEEKQLIEMRMRREREYERYVGSKRRR